MMNQNQRTAQPHQELRFNELIVCSVKRLTRPKFNHEFTQFNDCLAFSTKEPTEQSNQSTTESFHVEDDYDACTEQSNEFRNQQWTSLGANRHDVGYDGVPADCALNYVSTFGKISTGENFRVLFTIQNESSGYSLLNVRMQVRVQRISYVFRGMNIDRKKYYAMSREQQKENPLREQDAYPYELTQDQTIAEMKKRQQIGFHFNFKVDNPDTYLMFIRIDYASQYFVEELNRYIGSNNIDEQNQRNLNLRTREHIVDIKNRTVTKQFYQKFKFEALKPFETNYKVEFVNNSYLIQSVIQNQSTNKVFVEGLQFKNAVTKDLQLLDLNQIQRTAEEQKEEHEIQTVFDESVCFHPEEVRSYLYMLKPVKPQFKIDNSKQHILGHLIINWKNYMGDHGQLQLETFQNIQAGNQKKNEQQERQQADSKKDIEVQLVDTTKEKSNRLTLEKPQMVTFRLHNMTKNFMKLQLSVNEANQGDILICGCYPQISSKIEGFRSFDFQLELLPRTCGVAGISGLRIYDSISDKQYELKKNFAQFTVDFNK